MQYVLRGKVIHGDGWGRMMGYPTANLDRISSQSVMEIFQELHAKGQTIIMVTHEDEYGTLADRIIHLDDGRIVGAEKR